MKFIIGKKQEMTQIWCDDTVVAVTKVKAGPCFVTQIRTEEKDGYKAAQIGFEEKKEKNVNKPQKGHFKGLKNLRYLKEFELETEDLKKGDVIDLSTFEEGDTIDITSISKGKGFQGVVKRHGFSGSKKTHGNKDQLRMPGSIGATGPAHVFKGTRMGGRTGGDQVTLKNSEIVKIDIENNEVYIKGGVPGARNTLVILKAQGELKFKAGSVDVQGSGELKESKKEEKGVKEEKKDSKK